MLYQYRKPNTTLTEKNPSSSHWPTLYHNVLLLNNWLTIGSESKFIYSFPLTLLQEYLVPDEWESLKNVGLPGVLGQLRPPTLKHKHSTGIIVIIWQSIIF